ncbi:MAG: S8 family serine peptidase [Spirochaetota bacterium]|nr:S8 family serine peptidase [Spirochaetota bacterium]
MNPIVNKKLIIISIGFVIHLIPFTGCDKDDNDPDFPYWLINPQTCICSDDSSQDDPLYADQWHLENRGQGGGTPGEDVNVTSVWDSGNKGEGIVIAVVDDGLDVDHEDLYYAIYPNLNYNYLTNGTNVTLGSHGTSVAGVLAARDMNDSGGRGVAPCACLACYNLLQAINSANEFDAMIRNNNNIHISNNSWGPPDYTGQLIPADSSWLAGIAEGLGTGRDGKGIIYLWAAGNGGKPTSSPSNEIDNSNYDGYANSYGVMAIGALADNGERAYYSEKGANLWVCTYSSGGASGITTTDITGEEGYDPGDYTDTFGGTSSATPLAAGVVALMLNTNPNLSWRDVRLILAKTAKKVDASDTDWTTNGGGYNINHKYGFGGIDAEAAVNMTKSWTNIPDQSTYSTPSKSVNITIPDNNSTGISDTISISSGIDFIKIEYVSIEVTIDHSYSGDLEIILTSPSGTDSVLSEKHICYEISDQSATQTRCSYFNDAASFTFGSARHLDESPIGVWTLNIKDLQQADTGSLIDWSMKFYGRE